MDLHAHLDMKPAMGPLIRGDFHSEPRSTDWTSRLQVKATSKSLTALEAPSLIVVSLYGHTHVGQTFHWDQAKQVQAAIESEYQTLVEFTQTHPLFAIAKTPTEAENLLQDHRIPLVLSIEGAWGTVDTVAGQQKWIVDRGVSMVTFAHLTGDDLSGTALFSNFFAAWNAPLQFWNAILLSGGKCLMSFCKSPEGLSNRGREVLDQLFKLGVWIDLSHTNDMTLVEVIPMLRAQKHPVLMTHTAPREVYPAERGFPNELIEVIRDVDGMIGLIPTQDMLKKSWLGARCFSGLLEFKQSVAEMVRLLGPERVSLASDINAPLAGLSPLCEVAPGHFLSPLEKDGFYTYSQWKALAQFVSPSTQWVEQHQRHFIQLWHRIRSQSARTESSGSTGYPDKASKRGI
jgi:microsomal dipeptidase-like Zn-dependent dipeptidase